MDCYLCDVKQELIKRFGEERVLDIPVSEGEVALLALNLELRTPVTVILTNGLSDYKMPVPEKEVGKEHNELFFCLPSYWEWENLENPNMNWIFSWIQRLAKHVVEKETWFGHGHTIPCSKEMNPISDTMRQNHFMLMRPLLLEEAMAPVTDGEKDINFLAIVPIFEDELDYKQGKGTLKLIRKFINKGVDEKLDDYRATVLRSKWRLRR